MADATNINDKPASKANENTQARQISSLSNFNLKMQEQTKKEIKSMDKRIESIMRYQAMSKKRAEYAANAVDKSMKANRDLSSSTAKILSSMNNSIRELAIGTKKITTSTAVASKDLLDQYGKAISQDISYNKQNMVATALSQATPIFGYFASKFMETQVFQDAADKIKSKLSNAVGDAFQVSKGLMRSAGDKISNMFTRSGKIEYSEESKRYLGDAKVAAKDVASYIKKMKTKGEIKHAQSGGYVKRGGLVNVHSGEVITPIEKLPKIQGVMARARKSMTEENKGTFGSITKLLAENAARMEDYVAENQKVNRNVLKTFVHGIKTARDPGQKSWQDRMLRATLEMKIAMTGMTSRLRIAWQKVLTEHPLFRNMLGTFELLKAGIFTPVKFLFGMRGGYRRYLPRGQNQFQNINQILNTTFVQQMIRLDKIVVYLEELVEGILGKDRTQLKEIVKSQIDKKDRESSFFQDIQKFMSKEREEDTASFSEKLFSFVSTQLQLDRKAMEKAGITSVGAMFNPLKVMRGAGINKENIERITRPEAEAAQAGLFDAQMKARQKKKEYTHRLKTKGVEAKEFAEEAKEKAQEKLFDAQMKARQETKKGKHKAKGLWASIKEKLPKYQKGGVVEETGPAVVHKGETVTPASKMTKLLETFNKSTKTLQIFTKNIVNAIPMKVEEMKMAAEWRKGRAKQDIKHLKNKATTKWDKLDKMKLAVQSAIFAKSGGWLTGSSFIGEGGKIDWKKAKKFYIDKPKAAAKWVGEKTAPLRERFKGVKETAGKGKETVKEEVGKLKKFAQKHGFFLETLTDRLDENQKRHTKRMKDARKEMDKYDDKLRKQHGEHLERSSKLWKRFEENAEKRRDRVAAKVFKWKDKAQIALENKISDIKTNAEIKRQKKINAIANKGIEDRKKIEKGWDNRTVKMQNKALKKIEKKQKGMYAGHNRLMKFMFNSQYRFEKLNERRRRVMLKQQEKLEKKREKAKNKVDKLKLKIAKQREAMQTKLEAKKAKIAEKLKNQEAKLKGRLTYLQEKQKMKQQLKQAKIDRIKEKQKLKKERIEMKKKMIEQRAEIKAQTKKFKEQMKEEKKQLKIELKEARKQQWEARKTLFKERYDYLKNTPKRLAEFRKQFTQDTQRRIKLAKKQIMKLSKLEGIFIKVKDTLAKGFGLIKKFTGGFLKWILIGANFLKNIIFGGMRRFIPQLLGGTIGRMAGGMAVQAGGGLRALGGVAGIGYGGYKMYQDAMAAREKSKEWGTSALSATIGGALGGTEGGTAGALHGVTKGGALGAGIGTAILPGIGTAIGGAIGVVAGGIMGFVGGKNISKGMDFIAGSIKSLVKGIWKFITSPFTTTLELTKKFASWIAKKAKDAYSSLKFEILVPFKWLGSLLSNLVTGIKDYAIDKISSIPGFGWLAKDKNVKEKQEDAINESKTKGGRKSFESYDEFIARKQKEKGTTIPQAQVGAFVTKTGLVKVHAGEIISPLSDELKERIESAVISGKDIAKSDVHNEAMKTKFMIEENAKVQKQAMDNFAKTTSLSNATVINNITNTMSHSMQSIANSLGNKDNGHYDPLAKLILEGDIN